MQAIFSKRLLWPLLLLMTIGLSGLVWMWRRNQPPRLILRILQSNGMPEQTAKYWVAVSMFETATWTSRVYKDSNNLFCLIIPKSNRLPYGEGQTIFGSKAEAAQALIDHVIKPFKYAMNFTSIDALVEQMKAKGYFTSGLDAYTQGVKAMYAKQYGQ